MSYHQPKNDERKGGIAVLLTITAFLPALPFMVVAFVAAVLGAGYRTVKVIIFPVIFLLTQVFAGLIFMCFGWFIALILQDTAMANYVMGNTSELVLLSFIFGDPFTIPIWHVVAFQIVVWLFIGRAMARHITLSIYDYAIQTIGLRETIHPYYVRERVVLRDSGYEKAYAYYVKKGYPPLLGLVLVGLSPTPITEYY